MLDALRNALCVTPAAFDGLKQHVDPAWLEQAFRHATGGASASLRKRKLPLESALWLVIGMALFRDRSIRAAADHLSLVVGGDGSVSPGAIPDARARLGSGPLEVLFDLSAASWSRSPEVLLWRGLSVWAMDGTCFSLPDTPANDATYGRSENGDVLGPFPKARAVALANARTHVLAGFEVGAYDEGELSLLSSLWQKIPDHSITLVDRGLTSWWAFDQLTKSGTERHWLTRSRFNLACTLVRKLGRNDDLVQVAVSRKTRQKYPDAPSAMVVRRISITVMTGKGRMRVDLLTSALDPEKYPASGLTALYRDRWEIEIAYDELKTHLLEAKDTLRSQTPEGVRQELFGAAIAYNLVRVELCRVASLTKHDPRRLSFRHALLYIRNFMISAWTTAPGALPRSLASLTKDLKLLLLPQRRPRRFPREIKYRTARYPVRKPRPRVAK
jgi:hypothetical protein